MLNRKTGKAKTLINGKCAHYVKKLDKTMEEFTIFAQNKAEHFLKRSKQSTHNSIFTISLMIVSTIITGILFGFYFVVSYRKTKLSEEKIKNEIKQKERITRNLIESENKFRAIFEQAAVGVAQINSHTAQFIIINQRYADIVGYTIEEMKQLNFKEITHPNDLQKDLANMKRLLKNEIREFTMEKRYIHKSGSTIWVNLTVSPLWDIDEEPEYHIAVVEDITERKQVEKSLRLTLKENIKINNERKELLHLLSHDLSNPLNCLSGSIQLSGDDPENLKEYFEDIKSSVEIMNELLDTVKKIGAIEEHKLSLDLNSTNLLSAIEKGINILHFRVAQKDIQLEIDIDDSLFVYVNETTFVTSVIDNILSNSIKFSYPGSTIYISAKKYSNFVEIKFKDEGIGIPEDILNNIFNLHKRTSRNGTNNEPGTGFGMPLVKKLIDSYQGNITIRSLEQNSENKEHGTEIIISLPINNPSENY